MKAMDVYCPVCGAAPKAWCRSPATQTRVPPHRPRIAEARYQTTAARGPIRARIRAEKREFNARIDEKYKRKK